MYKLWEMFQRTYLLPTYFLISLDLGCVPLHWLTSCYFSRMSLLNIVHNPYQSTHGRPSLSSFQHARDTFYATAASA